MSSLDAVARVLRTWGLSLTEAPEHGAREAPGGGGQAACQREEASPQPPSLSLPPSMNLKVQQLAEERQQCPKKASSRGGRAQWGGRRGVRRTGQENWGGEEEPGREEAELGLEELRRRSLGLGERRHWQN